MTSTRNIDLDALKGIAILAVVFYHIGLLPFGYLGVDVFLVINGYFITKGLLLKLCTREFSYAKFLKSKLVRLWPLVIMACIVSLIIGYFTMLPDHYENLGQSIVSSNFFANNILSCITTGNYWDISNAYKPLMHFWYVGVLIQCYIVFPAIIWVILKFGKRKTYFFILFTIVFALLYILPIFTVTQRFYYLPFRLFEFMIGGIVAFTINDVSQVKSSNILCRIAISCLLILCIIPIPSVSNEFKVLITSILTGLAILLSVISQKVTGNKINLFYKVLSEIGIMSYSIFIWHQVAIAFYRYAAVDIFKTRDYLILLGIIILLSLASFHLYEKRSLTWRSKTDINKILIFSVIGASVASCIGLILYINAGVVRDVPELDIDKSNVHRGMHGEYCDRIYQLDKPFEDEEKIRLLAIGDSFARDFVNVLLESNYKDSLEISYIYLGYLDKNIDEYVNRIQQADIVAINRFPEEIKIEEIRNSLMSCNNLWGIGTKSFGCSMGYVYNRKQRNDYFETLVTPEQKILERYQQERHYWGGKYFDFMKPVYNNGLVRVFTDDNKFISQDCLHLTRSGAKFYSNKLNIDTSLGIN